MTLQELLDFTASSVLGDRSGQLSGASDALWSDEFLTRCFNEAQRILCREAWVLSDDSTAAVTEIDLVASTASYALHSSVLRVLSARLSDSDVDLTAASYEELRPRTNYDEDAFFDVSSAYTEAAGRPYWFASDQATKKLRLRPAPDTTSAALTLKLRVIRMPVTELVVTSITASPEVPAEYHLALTDYAAWRALSRPNADENYRQAAKDYKDAWEDTLAGAKRDRRRAQASPGRINLGSGGFSWVR